jgi:hypothetical protein
MMAVRNVVIKRVVPDFVKIDAGNDAMGVGTRCNRLRNDVLDIASL